MENSHRNDRGKIHQQPTYTMLAIKEKPRQKRSRAEDEISTMNSNNGKKTFNCAKYVIRNCHLIYIHTILLFLKENVILNINI